jgi:hypothetical protein
MLYGTNYFLTPVAAAAGATVAVVVTVREKVVVSRKVSVVGLVVANVVVVRPVRVVNLVFVNVTVVRAVWVRVAINLVEAKKKESD